MSARGGDGQRVGDEVAQDPLDGDPVGDEAESVVGCPAAESPRRLSSTPAALAAGANRVTVSWRRTSRRVAPGGARRLRPAQSLECLELADQSLESGRLLADRRAARVASSPTAVPSASAAANPPMTVSGVRRSWRRSASSRASRPACRRARPPSR